MLGILLQCIIYRLFIVHPIVDGCIFFIQEAAAVVIGCQSATDDSCHVPGLHVTAVGINGYQVSYQ